MPNAQFLRVALLLPIGLSCVASPPLAAEESPDEAIPTYYFSLPISDVMLLAAKEWENDCSPKARPRLASFLIPPPKGSATANHNGYGNSLLSRRFGPIDINGTRNRNNTADYYCITFPAARTVVRSGVGCAATQVPANGPIRFCGSADGPAQKTANGYEPTSSPVPGFRGSFSAYGFNTLCGDPAGEECQSRKNKELLNGLIHKLDPNVIVGF